MLAKPPPIGVVTGPFSPTRVRSIDSVSSLGMYSLIFFKGFGPGHEGFPFKLHAGGFENAHGRLRDFGADAVAGDEGDFVSHTFKSNYRQMNKLRTLLRNLCF